MFLLTEAVVDALHEQVILPQELQGGAQNKSLDGALARVSNRAAYGMIGDVFELAALYAMAVSQAHAFNDANKRTAFASMVTCLAANGIRAKFDAEEAGQKIIAMAQGKIEAEDLAQWLREQPPLYPAQESDT